MTIARTYLKILFINVRSLRNKIEYIEALLKEQNDDIDVLALAETWLYNNEICYMNIPDYSGLQQYP